MAEKKTYEELEKRIREPLHAGHLKNLHGLWHKSEKICLSAKTVNHPESVTPLIKQLMKCQMIFKSKNS